MKIKVLMTTFISVSISLLKKQNLRWDEGTFSIPLSYVTISKGKMFFFKIFKKIVI